MSSDKTVKLKVNINFPFFLFLAAVLTVLKWCGVIGLGWWSIVAIGLFPLLAALAVYIVTIALLALGGLAYLLALAVRAIFRRKKR